jgi:hypothetical protein
MRESRKKRKSRYLEEERWKKVGHARTRRAPGEKGVLERDTRGMCVRKIVTETREEKEIKALRARCQGGQREEKEEGSTSSRSSLLQRREELPGAHTQAEIPPGGPSPC